MNDDAPRFFEGVAVGDNAAQLTPSVPTTQEEEDPTLLTHVGDAFKGTWNGGVGAVQETGQFLWDVADAADNALGINAMDEKMPGYDGLESMKGHISTTTGHVAEGISNFVVGFIGAGKFLKGAKLLQGAGRGMGLLRGAAQGAITDFTAFDPMEERLSNLVQSCPSLENPLTSALAAKADDTRWEGRLKNAAEGLVMGTALDLLVESVRGLRGMSHAASPEEAAEVAVKVADKLEALQNGGVSAEAGAGKLGSKGRKVGEKLEELQTSALPEGRALEGNAPDGPAPFMRSPEDFSRVDKAAKAPEAAKAIGEAGGDKELLSLFKEVMTEAPRDAADFGLKTRDLLNTKHFTLTDESGRNTLEYLSAKYFDETIMGKGGPKSLDQIVGACSKNLRDGGIFDQADIARQLAVHEGNQKAIQQAAKDMFVLDNMAASAQREWHTLGCKIMDGATDSATLGRFQFLQKSLAELTVAGKDARTSAGRLLVSLKAPRTDAALITFKDAADLQAKLEKMDFRNTTTTLGNTTRALQTLRTRGMGDMATELWINNVLSGPITHAVNMTSNAVKAFVTPLYRASGAAVGLDFKAAKEHLKQYVYLQQSLGPSVRLALQSFREDRAILEGSLGNSAAWLDGIQGSTNTVQRAWSKENVLTRYVKKQVENGIPIEKATQQIPERVQFQANLAEMLGKGVNLPTRFLQAEDEFFKQLSARSELRADLTAEALDKLGGKAAPNEIGEYVAMREKTFFDETGRLLDDKYLGYAKKATFTQDLSGISKQVSDISNSHPLLKLVLPFVKTPTNLILEARDMTPLALASKDFRAALKEGGKAAAEARGKVLLGSSLMAYTYMLAGDGTITGSGPTDRAAREALMRTGWRPNSIKWGDSYYTFTRFDPFSTVLTAAANLAAGSEYLTDKQREDKMMNLFSMQLRVLGDKSYLKSFGDLLDALQGDEAAGSRLASGIVGGFVPFSGALRFGRTLADGDQREAGQGLTDIADGIRNGIPGLSDSLPAKRDWLTGKPLTQSFGLKSEEKSDPVAHELAKLQGVFKTPSYKVDGVEMTEAQHSRYCELIGTTKLGGRTLHQRLSETISSRWYDKDRKVNQDDDGGRSAMLNKNISAYRKAAWEQLLKEDPDFQQLVKESEWKRKQQSRPNGSQRPYPGVRSPQPSSAQQRGVKDLQRFAFE